jgi:hypothetical protein
VAKRHDILLEDINGAAITRPQQLYREFCGPERRARVANVMRAAMHPIKGVTDWYLYLMLSRSYILCLPEKFAIIQPTNCSAWWSR